MGTWLLNDDQAKETIRNGLRFGWRGIDTAAEYFNETSVGKGIWNTDVERSSIFVTSKISASVKNYQEAKSAIQDSLRRLSLDYIDLLLIHSPQPWIELGRTSNHYFQGNLETWQAMIEALEDKRLRAIGVSNFGIADLKNILMNSPVKPTVNQIEINLGHTPLKLIAYCQENDILPVAYSPLAHGHDLQEPLVRKYAGKYDVSPAQFLLRYVLQLGVGLVTKCQQIAHMKENQRLNFAISDQDMAKLKEVKL